MKIPSLPPRGYTFATLTVVTFVAALSWLTWSMELARYSDELRTLAIMGARSTDSFFTQTRGALAFLAEDVAPAIEDAAGTVARMETFRKRFPGLASVALIDPKAGTRLGQVPATSTEKDPTLDAALEGFRAREDFSIGRPVLFSDRGWYLALRFAVRIPRNDAPPFIEAWLPLTTAEGFWSGSPLPPGMVLGIVRDDGYLLVRHPTPADTDIATLYRERRSGTVYNKLREANFPQSGLVEGRSASTGGRTLTAFQRFANMPLTFRVSVPRSTILAAWWRTVIPLYAVTALLVGGLVATYLWQTRLERRNLAERAARLEELEAANRQLRRANEELETFSFAVAHDLRTPLRSITAFSQIVRKEFGERLGDQGTDLVERINGAGQRMAELIEGMILLGQYSRRDVARADLDTAALVAALVATLPPSAAGAEIVIGPLPPCNADPVLLRVIWSNLLDNALKFSRTQAAPRIEIGFSQGEFHVRDNGIGFDPHSASDLFRPFERLHNAAAYEGIGIGLAIVKRLVELHGGKVRASSNPGGGAEFGFSIGPQSEKGPVPAADRGP